MPDQSGFTCRFFLVKQMHLHAGHIHVTVEIASHGSERSPCGGILVPTTRLMVCERVLSLKGLDVARRRLGLIIRAGAPISLPCLSVPACPQNTIRLTMANSNTWALACNPRTILRVLVAF
jgi:hypothetical protein